MTLTKGRDIDHLGQNPASIPRAKLYVALILSIIAFLLAIFILWGSFGRDHFASMPRGGDRNWYQNYFYANRIELQDRDILYHNIGASIDHARAADIVLLGHSMLLFGLDDAMLRAFEQENGVKIFNMASAGDASGEFLRRIIDRWQIHPKLWIINADDHAADFFSVSIDAFGNSGLTNAGHVMSYNRFKAFSNVVARDIRWQLEALTADLLPTPVAALLLKHTAPVSTWRSAVTGEVDHHEVSVFVSDANPPIVVKRDQNCHATPADIVAAQSFIGKIGGQSLLTLFPHTDQCPQRVFEIAQSLNASVIAPPTTNYTAFDQTHMDRRGAAAFTTFFLQSLVKTPEFQALLAQKRGEADPGLISRLSAIDVCLANTTSKPAYFSLRRAAKSEDFALAPGQSIRRSSDAFAYVCQSDVPFGSNLCPAGTSAKAFDCPSTANQVQSGLAQ